MLVVWKNFEDRTSTKQPGKTYQLSTPEGIKIAVKETQPQINKPVVKDNLAGKPPAKKGPPKKKSNKRR